MTAAEKQAILDKIEELRGYIAQSLPLRAVGGGHIHNELQKLKKDIEKIATA